MADPADAAVLGDRDRATAEELAKALTGYDDRAVLAAIEAAVAEGNARSVLLAMSMVAGTPAATVRDPSAVSCAFCGADVAGLAVTTAYAGITVELCGDCASEHASPDRDVIRSLLQKTPP